LRRLLFAILLVLALLAVPVAAIAQTYIISVQLTESGGSTYAEGAWTLFVNNAYLASTGQESSTGLDTQFLLGGVTLPEMVADNRTTFACPLSARTTSNLQYTLGNALASSFNVILGYNGSITTLASTTLNIGGAGSVNETGYFDPTLSATLLSIPTANGTFAIQGDGSGSLTSPSMVAYAPTFSGSSATGGGISSPISVTLPTSSAGDLLVVALSMGDNVHGLPTTTTPSGWIALASNSVYYGPDYSEWSIFYKIAVGSEGTSLSVTFTGADYGWSAESFKILAGRWTGTPVLSSMGSGTSVSPAPPSLTSGFGAVQTCWIALAAASTSTITGYPTGYTVNSTVGSYPGVGACAKITSAASESPGTFTCTSCAWGAYTLAVRETSLFTFSTSAISAGVHNIAFAAGSGNVSIASDGVTLWSTACSSFPACSSNLTFGLMTYFNYIKVYKAGVLNLWFQPNTMISGTTLPDRAGTNNGTIVWGNNPSGVAVAMVGTTPHSQSAFTVSQGGQGANLMPKSSGQNPAGESGGTQGTNFPFYALFKAWIDAYNSLNPTIPLTMPYFWMIVGFIVVFMVMILAGALGSFAIMIAAAFALGVMCIMHIYDWKVLYLYLLIALPLFIFRSRVHQV